MMSLYIKRIWVLKARCRFYTVAISALISAIILVIDKYEDSRADNVSK